MRKNVLKIVTIITLVIITVSMFVTPCFAWSYDNPDIEVVTSTSMPTTYRENVVYAVTLDSTNEWAGQWLFNTTLTDIPSVSTNYRFMYTVGSEDTVRNSITLSLAGVMKYDNSNAYVDGTWNMSRYITIVSEPSASFLVWLKANARRLTTPTVKVTKYYLYIAGEAVQFPTLIDAVNYLYQGTAEDYINGTEFGNRDLYYELEGYLNSIYQDGRNDGYTEGLEVNNPIVNMFTDPIGALFSITLYETNGFELTIGGIFFTFIGILLFVAFLRYFAGG